MCTLSRTKLLQHCTTPLSYQFFHQGSLLVWKFKKEPLHFHTAVIFLQLNSTGCVKKLFSSFKLCCGKNWKNLWKYMRAEECTDFWLDHSTMRGIYKGRYILSSLAYLLWFRAFSKAYFPQFGVSYVILWIDMMPNAIQRGWKAMNSL